MLLLLKQLLIKYSQFIKYATVGLSGTFIDVVSLVILKNLTGFIPGEDPRFYILVTLAFILAATNNYIWNRVWTFESKEKDVKKQYSKFMTVATVGLMWTQLLMWVFVSLIGVYYIFAKLMTSALVICWNFMMNKFWTFREKHTHSQSEANNDNLNEAIIKIE